MPCFSAESFQGKIQHHVSFCRNGVARRELVENTFGLGFRLILSIYRLAPTARQARRLMSTRLPPSWRRTVTPLDHQAPADLGLSKPCNLQGALWGMFNWLPVEKPEAVIFVVEFGVIHSFIYSCT